MNRFYQFLNLSNFPEIAHGISTREYGNMKFTGSNEPPEIIENRSRFCRDLGISLDSLVVPEIVHSANINIVTSADKGKGAKDWKTTIRGSDGLISQDYGVGLMVTTADCVSILIYDPVNKTVASIHAGWRGIAEGIGRKAIDEMKKLGSWPESLIIGIGPAICQKHFIVKNEVSKIFSTRYPKAVFVRNHDGYVDLKKCLAEDFVNAGVPDGNIEMSPDCTVCNSYYYSSFRAEKERTVFQASIISLRD